ncbi:Uncharacterised protein r2_g1378 [Pycnogonum litorale]
MAVTWTTSTRLYTHIYIYTLFSYYLRSELFSDKKLTREIRNLEKGTKTRFQKIILCCLCYNPLVSSTLLAGGVPV